MFSRRQFIFTATAALSAILTHQALADPPAPNDPMGILTAIYTRAAKGKGDGGGAFVIENKAAKAKYLSKSLIELWAKSRRPYAKG